MSKSDIDFQNKALKLVEKYSKSIKPYTEKRYGRKIVKLAKAYNLYVGKVNNELKKIIGNVDAKLKSIVSAENANNAYEYFEREQRNYLAITEKRRRDVLKELARQQKVASSSSDEIVKSHNAVTSSLKKELTKTTDRFRLYSINEDLENSNNAKKSITSGKKEILKSFDGLKKIVNAMEFGVKEVRMNLLMKGIQTEDTLLDAIYDKHNESGIIGALIKIRKYLIETKNSKLSIFTRDTQKYLDLVNKNPYGLEASFSKLEAAANLDLPKTAVTSLNDEQILADKEKAKTAVKYLEEAARVNVHEVIDKINAEYSIDLTNVTKANINEKIKELKEIKKKFESVKDGKVVDFNDDFEGTIDSALKEAGFESRSDRATFFIVAFNLFKIMVFGELYEFLISYADHTGTGSGGGIIFNRLISVWVAFMGADLFAGVTGVAIFSFVMLAPFAVAGSFGAASIMAGIIVILGLCLWGLIECFSWSSKQWNKRE